MTRHGNDNLKTGIIATLAAMIIVMASDAALAGQIRIWPTATVSSDTVLLRDIAEVRGFDGETVSKLAEVIVYGAPRVGGEALVRTDDVREALRESGINLAEVRMFGASRCKVTRSRAPREARAIVRPATAEQLKDIAAEPERAPLPEHKPIGPKKLDAVEREGSEEASERKGVEPDSLEHALRQHIAGLFTRDDGRVEIRFSPTSEKVLAIGGPDLRYRIRNRDLRRTGLIGFEIEILSPGAVTQEVLVSAEVTLMKSVVVARRPINQGQIINGRDLMLEERRFDRNEDVGLVDLAAAVGQQSKRFMRQGEMIDARSIETRPLVRRGDLVKVVMSGGGVEIRTTGQAQSAGALGDTITVRRDGSRRKQELIDVVVAGPGLVTYGVPQRVASRGE